MLQRSWRGQLRQQRELRPDQPGVQELSNNHLLPACDRWIHHVMDRQPPQGRGPWVPGRYRLQMIDLWLNCQTAGVTTTPPTPMAAASLE